MSATDLSQSDPNLASPPAPSSSETHAPWTSEPVIESLRQTRPWVLFFSIIGFLSLASIIFAFFAVLADAAFFMSKPIEFEAGESVTRGIGLVLLGVLYFIPSLYLWRFARRIRILTQTHQLADLEAALAVQKSFWKFCGIAASLLIAIYAFIGLFAGLAILEEFGRG